jgi:hypothetical protein
MSIATYEAKDEFSATCILTTRGARSGMDCREAVGTAPEDLTGLGVRRKGSGCAVGIRFVILLEVAASILIYGAWRLFHLL